MRSTVIALALFVCPTLAAAGPTNGGSGGGGGRLGQVSGGLRNPPSPPRPPSPPSGGAGRNPVPGDRGTDRGSDVPLTTPVVVTATAAAPVVVFDDRGAPVVVRRQPPTPDGGTARFEAYAGAQKVHESQGAWHVEFGVRDGLFRLRGQITRYYEEQPQGDTLTLTMPALIAGVRVDGGGSPTRLFFEGGVVNARTGNDPVEDTSHTGGVFGFRLEHRVARKAKLLGEVHEMFYTQDIRAHSARVGIKLDVLQASFRVLDFNVGPALYGPEIGLAF